MTIDPAPAIPNIPDPAFVCAGVVLLLLLLRHARAYAPALVHCVQMLNMPMVHPEVNHRAPKRQEYFGAMLSMYDVTRIAVGLMPELEPHRGGPLRKKAAQKADVEKVGRRRRRRRWRGHRKGGGYGVGKQAPLACDNLP